MRASNLGEGPDQSHKGVMFIFIFFNSPSLMITLLEAS
jgi:hypothetical protein